MEGDSGIDHGMNVDISDEEYTLLAAIIYCEAGGESYEGQLAVGYVIMEADPDVKGKVTDSCRRAAAEVLSGSSNVGESLFFRTHKPVPQLEENLKANEVPYYIIGGHIFYHRWVAY